MNAGSNHGHGPVVESLARFLADTYALYLKTQNYHWNVEGPQFAQLHSLFEEQYNDLATTVDEIAERIRALGAPAPGSFAEFQRLGTLALLRRQCWSPSPSSRRGDRSPARRRRSGSAPPRCAPR